MWDYLIGEEMLNGYMEFLNKKFLLDDDVFAANLFKSKKHNQVGVDIGLTHLTEQVQQRRRRTCFTFDERDF